MTKPPRPQAEDPLHGKSNGYPRAESRGREAYLKQYVDRPSDEPARWMRETGIQAGRSGVSAIAGEAIMNNVG
ncbi:MAG: hypothetical protein AB7G48_01500 [Nitrospiraceae bacterium]